MIMKKVLILILIIVFSFSLVACLGTNYPGKIKPKYWASEDTHIMFWFPAEAGHGKAEGIYFDAEGASHDILLEWDTRSGIVEVKTSGYEKIFTANTTTLSANLTCTFEIISQEEQYNFPTKIVFNHIEEGVDFYCRNGIHTWEDEPLYIPGGGSEEYFRCLVCGTIEKQHIDIGYAFNVTVTGETNLLAENLLEVYSAPSPVTIKTNVLMDADIAIYVNDKRIEKDENISDDNYWYYSFIMPYEDVVIRIETETIDYIDVRNILNIPSILESDVKKVRCEQGYIGVAPGNLTTVKYSTDVEDITSLLALLEMTVYEEKSNDWQIDGGGYVLYSIITNDSQYDIRISNGYIHANQKHYKFIGEYAILEYPSLEAHSYITYGDTYEAYTMQNVYVGEFDGLSKLEFIDYPHETIPENENLGYIETEIGRIYIHSENIFYTKEDNLFSYYLIVGENNFSDVFVN